MYICTDISREHKSQYMGLPRQLYCQSRKSLTFLLLLG